MAVPLEHYILTHTYGERDVVRMASGVCTALGLCHSRGIVHGDIKPQNLFVNEAGYDGKPVLRLGDFGSGALVPDAAGDFASPEVLCGDEPDAQSDLYSLGMVLYCFIMERFFLFAVNYLVALFYGLFGAVAGVMGDLTMSVIKRQVGIKDYGNLIPGHGGILDRFDSVMITAPLTEALLLLIPMVV
jgi:serine/threonine protein kinase